MRHLSFPNNVLSRLYSFFKYKETKTYRMQKQVKKGLIFTSDDIKIVLHEETGTENYAKENFVEGK